MGLHLVALVKLKLMIGAGTSHNSLTPLLVTTLVCPFVLKICLSLRSLPQVYDDISHASRLFFFQLGQIAFHVRQEDLGNQSRWERALRVFCQMVTGARRSPASLLSSDEAHRLHDLSMITL